ncbi:class I SAM-dependent methyltransferase [Actinoplanes sp. TBRC 11911]|uniref:hypothetical protein n=1 Tax=Actinoplanes sp. TBRC 11911 TaxID=2729386 RepID=UPI00145F90E9|nr:hypothetical protein [Actinoplanes sp. TBRC 11911]NMO55033.1 class I SAM-dependent methyltransferase [Actinoplanes sp. TBRC 11911]
MTDAAALLPLQGTDFASALAAPPVPNLRRIGGEMFAWSDRDPQRGPALPRGAAMRHLLRQIARPGSTVLVAGPHADELVSGLVQTGAAVTWLLRSLLDAEQAARAFPEVTVLTGAVVKLDPAQRYDLVVAADGVERLNSVEGEQMAPAELIDRLAEAVHPDGVLVLMHDNHLGLHHTVRLEPGAHERLDANWYPVDDHDPHRPASRRQLVDRLAGAGLRVATTYATFPEPAVPTVLIGESLIGDVSSPLRPLLGTAVNQALVAGFRGKAVLSDPRQLANRALRAGAEDTVAPAWLVIARGAGDGVGPVVLSHELLVGDARGTFAYEVATAGDEIRTSVLNQIEGTIERAGLRRISEPVTLGADRGYVLEERLLHLAATADVREMRIELARYDSWLRDQERDGLLTGPAALAGFADIMVTENGLTLLPTRWEPIEPVAREVAEIRAGWQFAVQLVSSASPHPWALNFSAVDLTAIVLGMVGIAVGDAQVREAVELHMALETADSELSLAEQHDRQLQLLSVRTGSPSVDVDGFREMAEANWRQRYEASHLVEMMAWTDQMIRSRDLALSKLDWEIQFYKKSWAGRVLWIFRSALKVVKKLAGGQR